MAEQEAYSPLTSGIPGESGCRGSRAWDIRGPCPGRRPALSPHVAGAWSISQLAPPCARVSPLGPATQLLGTARPTLCCHHRLQPRPLARQARGSLPA